MYFKDWNFDLQISKAEGRIITRSVELIKESRSVFGRAFAESQRQQWKNIKGYDKLAPFMPPDLKTGYSEAADNEDVDDQEMSDEEQRYDVNQNMFGLDLIQKLSQNNNDVHNDKSTEKKSTEDEEITPTLHRISMDMSPESIAEASLKEWKGMKDSINEIFRKDSDTALKFRSSPLAWWYCVSDVPLFFYLTQISKLKLNIAVANTSSERAFKDVKLISTPFNNKMNVETLIAQIYWKQKLRADQKKETINYQEKWGDTINLVRDVLKLPKEIAVSGLLYTYN